MEVEPARQMVPRLRALIDAFRAKRVPVVFTELVYSERAPVLVGAAPRAQARVSRTFGAPSSSS